MIMLSLCVFIALLAGGGIGFYIGLRVGEERGEARAIITSITTTIENQRRSS